jgi:hypothetical protein
MPFNHLLFEALQAGKTLAEDRKSGCRTTADLKRGAGETVLLFQIDGASTRKHLRLAEKKCCDHAYFFKSVKVTLLIFVEMKSTNLDGAVDQILNAHEAICFHPNLKAQSPRSIGVIVSTVAFIPDSHKIKNRIGKRKINLYFKVSRNKPYSINELITGLS